MSICSGNGVSIWSVNGVSIWSGNGVLDDMVSDGTTINIICGRVYYTYDMWWVCGALRSEVGF